MQVEQYNQKVYQDLSYIGYGSGPEWISTSTFEDEHVYDVIIIGGGQSGLATAFALKRERISNLLILDENPAGFEGPWITYARMVTLRTPKELPSIDLGVPSLTFRAYWTATRGEEAWEKIDKIPRQDWMDYLKWYREVLELPVQNDTKALLITPIQEHLFKVSTIHNGEEKDLYAKKVVLATGIQGGGEWHIPSFISDTIDKKIYSHTSENINFNALKGKKIGILGGGASAYDNAHFALQAGVQEAHVFIRRKDFNRVNPMRKLESCGLIERYHNLSDEEKYIAMAHFFQFNQPPTNDTYNRSCAFEGFHVHLDSPWDSLEQLDDEVVVKTPHQSFTFDYLIISTGLVSDSSLRSELAAVNNHILTWGDVYTAPKKLQNDLLDSHPYLSPSFEFQSKTEEGKKILKGLYAFNYGALLSCGVSASALSGIRFAVPKLAMAIANELFLDQKAEIIDSFLHYSVEEFVGKLPEKMQKQSI